MDNSDITKSPEPMNIVEETENESDGYHFLGSITERVVFILFLTLLSTAPILFGESIPSHADWHIHVEHAYSFKTAFLQGQFLPRWIDSPVNGYGLPIFNFYAPLVYYIFTFVDLFVNDPIISIKAAFVIPMFLCTIFGYLFLRRHGSPISCATAMAFLIFSPAIHIFIYNTNWPGSTLALAFIFLALYGIDSFNREKNLDIKNILIVSFAYAGMALAHLASAFVFTLLSIPYFLFNLWIHKSRTFVKNFIASFALGGCLSAFYLFPATLEKEFIHVDEVLTQAPLWDFSKNFLFTYLDREAGKGYAWAIFDHRYYEVSNALFALAVLICLVIVLVNMDKVKNFVKEPFRVVVAAVMFIFAFLMMTPTSIFIWILIKPLQTIQFPWRFTAFVLPFGTLLMVYAFDLFKYLTKEHLPTKGFKVLFSFLFVIFSMLAYVDFINMYNWQWVPEQSLLKATTNVLWANEEYTPNISGNPEWKNINYKQDFSPTVFSSNSNAKIDLVEWLAHKRVFQVFSTVEQQIQLRLFYFPGWSVYVDGKPEALQINKNIGAIVFKVPPGQHEVTVQFEDTPIRKYSKYLSLIALIAYSFLILKLFKKSSPKKIETSSIDNNKNITELTEVAN